MTNVAPFDKIVPRLCDVGSFKTVRRVTQGTRYVHEISIGVNLSYHPVEVSVSSISRNPEQVHYLTAATNEKWEFGPISVEPDHDGGKRTEFVVCKTRLSNVGGFDITVRLREGTQGPSKLVLTQEYQL
jgi:hypothetical protein